MKTNVQLTMLITALFLLPVIVVCQAPDIKLSYKVGKHTPTVPTDNALLYGQLSTPSNEGPVASQDFTDSTAYSCQAADDFIVPAGETWLIDQVFFSGWYEAGGGPAPAAHLFIYLNDTLTAAPGVLVAELIDFPVTASPEGDLTFDIQQAPDIDPIILEQGHYWISVQPHMPYTPYKQWFWKKQENGPPDDYPFQWENPGGGFGLPYPNWTPSTVVFEGTLDHNLTFAIYGEKMGCPVVVAGEDATLCEGESFTASATAGNTCGLMWTTNGDGTFDNTGSASATYTPGIADIDLGGATLCLIGQACAPCTQNAQDCLEITIQAQPAVFAGNDLTVCEGDPVILSQATASNHGSLQWITTNGFGYFDNENILNPTYTPSPMDYAQGCISMALSADPISPCTYYVIDFINVCFQPPPTADAGADATIQEGEDYKLSATAGNTCGLLWTTSGDGIFDDDVSLSATYTPGFTDIATGSATLCLSGAACAPCTQDVQDCLELTIEALPAVNAGPDATICVDPSKKTIGGKGCFPLSGTVTGTFNALQWYTINGTGYFDNEHTLSTCYYYSPFDILQGNVTIVLAVLYKGSKSSLTDSMILTFQEIPTVDAGPDATICCGDIYTFTGATASNYSSLQWITSNGDGDFDDENILNPTYNPGQLDCLQGSVQICVYAQPIDPCTIAASDCMTLTFGTLPDVTLEAFEPLCAEAPMFDLYGGLPVGGIYFVDGIEATSFDPTTAGNYSLTYVYTDANGCTNSAEGTITVNPLPEVTLEAFEPLCAEAPMFDLYGGLPEGGTYSVDGIEATSFDPTTAGDYSLTYVYTDANGCTNSAEGTITVNPLPDVNCPSDFSVCIDEPPFMLSEAMPVGGEYSGPGVSDEFFDAEIAGAGTHTIYYEYVDENGCYNSCFFDITVVNSPSSNAGPDGSICEGDSYQIINAEAADYSSLMWTTFDGSGFFDNPGILHPVYTPGLLDYLLGSVELCLNAAPIDPCTTGVSDCMILTFLEGPAADAGEDATICGELAYPLAEADAAIYAHLLWVTYGSGTFSDPYSLNPTYYPSMIDILLGSVELCLNAAPIEPCATGFSDCIVLTFLEGPTADAGEDATICGEQSYPLVDANAADYAHLLWVTYGSGTFSDPYSLNPTYSPSMIDVLLGSVELCLNAAPIEPCATGFSDCMVLTFLEGPTVDAGEDATICGEQSYPLVEADAANYAHLLWVTYGTGTFSDPYSLNPTYSPSMIDVLLGSVELCLNAAPIDPCTTGASDCLILTFLEGPTADAGEDATICGESTYPLADADAADYAHLLWVTYGSGTFSDPYSLNPTYYPSMIDILLGSVELCLNAAPLEPCATGFSDCITLTFESSQQTVQVSSGWCGISSYLELSNSDMGNILDPAIDDLVILYNYSGIFYPEYGIFTIDEWDTYSGYVGKFNSPASLNFMGCDLENKTAYLNQAWNIIPVLSDQAYSVEDLFADKSNLQIVKEVAGTGVYWPAYNINTLGNVLPGKAYYTRMGAADSIDYANPGKGLSTIKPPDLSALVTPWNKITQTPSSHIVAFELSENALFENDIIGGFTTDGICAGLTKIQDASLPFAINLNGDDPYVAAKVGFTGGELFAFRLFRSSTGEVFDLEVSYKPVYDQSGLFVPNGMSVVYDVKLSPTGISNSSDHALNIYPNPSNGTFTIEGIHERINVRIFNAFGEEIYLNELILPARVDLSAQPKGMYFIRIETDNSVVFKKLVIN